MDAWFSGEFERCLQLCDAVRVRDAQTRCHLALARARALVRLYRIDEALQTLRDIAPLAHGTDESLTTRMLTGEAYVRCGKPDTALALLVPAQADAEKFDAHRTIRSEIALNIGLAQYSRHEFAAAERALDLISADADIVHARGIQYRAWIASARGQNERATSLFVQALHALDRCRKFDRYFEANCLRALAHLAIERLDAPTWDFVAARRARVDWSLTALAQSRFYITYCAAAYALDATGKLDEAMRESRIADELAPTDALRVQARCKRAAVARHAGEPVSQRDHIESAVQLFGTLEPAELTGDEKIVPLVVAEELANIDPAEALEFVALHRRVAPLSPLQFMAQSSLAETYRSLVEASVFELSGEVQLAVQRYREAFRALSEIGYRRRAVRAAIALWRLTGDQKALIYAERATSDLAPESYVRREIDAARDQAQRLTAVQQEVLSLICQGKSNPEIARLRKRSLHTIRNLVARLFEIFGVSSREELAVQSVRRGLYTPK